MVAIRHSVSTSDQQRTTVILLCEDGSLRIYMASAEHTGYWMAPEFQPTRLVWCILTLTLTVSEKKNSVSVDNVEVWENFRPVVRGK